MLSNDDYKNMLNLLFHPIFHLTELNRDSLIFIHHCSQWFFFNLEFNKHCFMLQYTSYLI